MSSEAGHGVPRSLAARRKAAIRELRYALRLVIPARPEDPVRGRVSINLCFEDRDWPPIDFAPAPADRSIREAIRGLELNGRPVDYRVEQGHIRLLAPPGGEPQRIDIEFTSGPAGLTRRDDHVYSLFVPARAHTVFPCFDQPDLRARLALELETPAEWEALANAPLLECRNEGDCRRWRFAATEPLPSYLYAFAAGRFRRDAAQHGGKHFEMLLPEGSATAFEANRDEILRLHAAALRALETYTATPQAFAQTGFVLIPDFEFAGMEHPGAVFYRENLLLLTRDATETDRMRRAHLIAHESAHLWFGDLVTMRWFDDVWLKEVCANFLADKLVAEEYPDADREARFVLQHFPAAYAIDRTAGTHAIREPLDNLADAAARYDALIYHKAPIAFDSLERAIGVEALREGLRDVLREFRFASFDWPELCERLQRHTAVDLNRFSRDWIETAGPPPRRDGFSPDGPPDYGLIRLDEDDRRRALAALVRAHNAEAETRHGAAAWIALFEDMLAGGIPPSELLPAGIERLEAERDAALVLRLLEDLAEIFWRFLDVTQRGLAAGPVERLLRGKVEGGDSRFWLRTLAKFAVTGETVAWLESLWNGNLPGAPGDALSERLAVALAVRRPAQANGFLERQIASTAEPARRRRLLFLAPALSADPAVREALFASLLAEPRPGLRELAALKLLNHPLRSASALVFLRPAIERAAGLHERGDIFLPRQWLTALFCGHGSADAAAAVSACLATPSMSTGFRRLLLQTADPLFRAAAIRGRSPRSGT